ncbi:MAG: hypothetical protein HUK20_09920 [Fibrobacter sp.]|nr:hypothetical protein [Fibrobacter sp.]
MLGIKQKKGLKDYLCGRMIAYAKIIPNPDGEKSGSPFDDMIRNGLLTLEGDFRQEAEMKQRKAIKESVDENLEDMLESLQNENGDLPSNIDVEAMRERLHELSNMEIIPIPARIGNFTNEEDILQEDADIYYIGEFIGANQAHYCLTTLPIYYQAKYREQARREEIDFVNSMLKQIESGDFIDDEDLLKNTDELFPNGTTLNNFVGDISKLLNTRVVPFLLSLESPDQYKIQIVKFFEFMKGYPNANDVFRIDIALRELRIKRDSVVARKLLELSCQKICAVYDEDKRKADQIDKAITELLK